ncbi:FKBP prolyl isomerase 16 [Chanos chanos]|uniref:peptidylprolyl isomerase n=1 Tax=Chanos chanos TaxID=29144 RepID=A0A6J2USH9_CHACN|nr:peptidyl-prolyl cis-trans isomerase FKBP8-like [Chanos chanos]
MVSLAPCGEMEQEAGEPEDISLDPNESKAMQTSPRPEDGEGMVETPSQQAVMGTRTETEKMDEECEYKEEKKRRVETELEEGMEKEDDIKKEEEEEEQGGEVEEKTLISQDEGGRAETECGESTNDDTTGHPEGGRRLRKTSSLGKTVRFQEAEVVEERDNSEETLFPEYESEEWTSSSFEVLFLAEDWLDITDDRLLRKKILEHGPQEAPGPCWGQEVTLKMQGVLEDRTVVEKDCKLVFVIGEGDVNQALEECAISMRKEEIALLLADSQYTYGLLGREPDIPAWAPLLYQLQLLDFRDKPDPLTLPISDRIRIGNQKRERGNFYFQREEYSMAARAYCMALDVLTTRTKDNKDSTAEEEEEVNDYRVKCLNNLAAAQLKLEQYDEALHTCRDVLFLDPSNVKALFRAGKLLSDKGEYEEAMETLKKALKLEPSTKAIHAELSKLVKRQAGENETDTWKAKPAQILGENIAPFLTPPKKKAPGISWKFLLGALVVALGSLVTSMVLTARN